MLLFPTLIALILLILVAQLLLVAPAVGRTYYRERRFAAQRPRMRAVLILTAIEIALVLVWSFFVLAQMR
ncbi:MAG TPA: hypothetical protein VJP45_05895 [Candidatus Limnocylindria bacterium]|nr:hypothetical protein [Candidatus Limnocylindria bacterium]